MQTTLVIDEDVVSAASELARQQSRSVEQIVSELARSALAATEPAPRYRNGILLLPAKPGSVPITTEFVKQLEEELF